MADEEEELDGMGEEDMIIEGGTIDGIGMIGNGMTDETEMTDVTGREITDESDKIGTRKIEGREIEMIGEIGIVMKEGKGNIMIVLETGEMTSEMKRERTGIVNTNDGELVQMADMNDDIIAMMMNASIDEIIETMIGDGTMIAGEIMIAEEMIENDMMKNDLVEETMTIDILIVVTIKTARNRSQTQEMVPLRGLAVIIVDHPPPLPPKVPQFRPLVIVTAVDLPLLHPPVVILGVHYDLPTLPRHRRPAQEM